MRLERLRDRLVSGIRDRKMMSELLKLKLEELTFDTAVAKCIAIEHSCKDVETMQGGRDPNHTNKESDSVNLLNKPEEQNRSTRAKKGRDVSPSPADVSPSPSVTVVKVIISINPAPLKMQFAIIVRRAIIFGELVENEARKHIVSNPPVNHIDDDDDDSDSDDYLASLEINKVGNKDNVIWVTHKVEGTPLRMELDTGSAVSVIPYQLYRAKFSHIKLQRRTYTGEKLYPKGKINCRVSLDGQTRQLDIQVIESSGPSLFGRDWLSVIKLDWGEIKALKVNQATDNETQGKVNHLLEKYKSVFDDDLGTLKGHQADLKLKENCRPRYCKARQVPYALRPKVEAELTCLEKEGILNKVEHSESATLIVPVVKRNGSVRICGDCKVSVNPVLIAEQHPLPRIEDIFANLAGGKHFTKLDLRQAYHQMEVTEETRKYLTINTHKGLFQYQRLVFGVTSSPAIWQRAMDQVLQGIPGTQCILDDMIIT